MDDSATFKVTIFKINLRFLAWLCGIILRAKTLLEVAFSGTHSSA